MTQRQLKFHLIVFACYFGIACLALYQPLFHANTHVGHTLPTDYYHFNWNYWWMRHALTTPGANVYETNYVLAPNTTNLAFHTLTPFWYPLWALFEPLGGTLAAMNVIMVLALALTGYCYFLLLRREGVAHLWALAGGVILQLTPAQMFSAMLQNVNYVALFWYPLQLLVWGKVADLTPQPSHPRGDIRQGEIVQRGEGEQSRLRSAVLWALVQGVCFYGMMLTDYQHLLFVAFLLIPYGVRTLVKAGGWRSRLALAALGGLALAVMLALLWFAGPLQAILAFDRRDLSPPPIANAQGVPFPLGYFWRIDPYARRLSFGALVLPAVVLALMVPWVQNPKLGSSWKPLKGLRQASGRGEPAARPYNSSIAASRWFWLALAIIPLLLSLGPFMMLGETTLPTPYVLLHQAFGGMFRVPARFAPVALIPALIFAFQTFTAAGTAMGIPLPARHQDRGQGLFPLSMSGVRAKGWGLPLRSGLMVGILVLVFGESRLYQPMPLMPAAPHYDFYQAIGREQGAPYDDMVIVEIPNAGGTGEAWVGEFPPMETQFYGIIHGKRMLNGSIARAPFGYYWYWLVDDPLLAWLGQRRFLEPANVEALLRTRIAEWQIGYFILHQQYIDRIRFPASSEEIIGYFNALPDVLCPVYVENDAVVFRTFWHPDGCPPRIPPEIEAGVYQIDIGTTGDERYLGWGWHRPESIFDITLRWMGEHPQTQVYLDLPAAHAYTLTFTAQAFWEAREVQVLVNGTRVGEPLTVTTDTLHEYTVTIPTELIGAGQHLTLTLAYDAVIVPLDVGQSADTRRLALAVDWLRFRQQ